MFHIRFHVRSQVRWARQYGPLALAGVLGLFAPGCMGDENDQLVETGPPAQGNEVDDGDEGQRQGQRQGQRAEEGSRERGIGYRGIVEPGTKRGAAFYIDTYESERMESPGLQRLMNQVGVLLQRYGQGGLSFDSSGEQGSQGQQAQQGQPAILSQAEIAGILKGFNEIEFDFARLAFEETENDLVRAFADVLLDHHIDAQARQDQLFELHGIDAVDTSYAEIAGAMDGMRERLEVAQGSDLDRAFVSAQIDVHLAMLYLVDGLMMHDVLHQAFIAEILEMRRGMEVHLGQAQEVEQRLRRE